MLRGKPGIKKTVAASPSAIFNGLPTGSYASFCLMAYGPTASYLRDAHVPGRAVASTPPPWALVRSKCMYVFSFYVLSVTDP